MGLECLVDTTDSRSLEFRPRMVDSSRERNRKIILCTFTLRHNTCDDNILYCLFYSDLYRSSCLTCLPQPLDVLDLSCAHSLHRTSCGNSTLCCFCAVLLAQTIQSLSARAARLTRHSHCFLTFTHCSIC